MKSLDTLQTTHPTFSIGKAISDGWSFVSSSLGYYILGGILAVLIGGAAGIIPFIGSMANNFIISPCFVASAIYITWGISKKTAWTDFGDIFKGFNYLLPIALSSLLQSVAMGILVILFFFNYLPQLTDLFDQLKDPYNFDNNTIVIQTGFSQFINTETVLLFLGLVLSLLILAAIWAFTTHFIVIYKLQAWPAMEMSRKIATHNLLQLVGLFFILGLIILVSILPCGIGLLFSLPLSIASVYSAFAQITACNEVEIDNDMFDFTQEDQP